ncbi:MAG: hypothetical protein HN348_10430 [Proteobacteria bacterium]|jgi:hypothetical protein|nr:hypothetical protein [Pseudomonadota bacterium]
MTTPFLLAFSTAVLLELERQQMVDLNGATERVAIYVANYLGTEARGGSLISGLSAALISCPEVDELYADNEQIKQIVDDLG